MNTAISIVFGLGVLACLFLAVTWFHVFCDQAYRNDRRYMLLAGGLIVANAGVALLALNRTVVAMSDYYLLPGLLLVAGIILVTGKVVLIHAATVDRSARPFWAFAILGVAWTVFCLARAAI